MKNKKTRLNLKAEILLGALALAVLAGLGTVAFAAAGPNPVVPLSGQTGQLSIFDPFSLTRLYLDVPASGPGTVTLEVPPIRIPYRPAIRSPFRPPWVPGPPGGVPGPPPWRPGPPF